MSYITFANLGSSANLGSQIQQYASMYAVAKETKKQIVFPESLRYSGWTIKFQNILEVDVEFKEDSFFYSFVNFQPKDQVLDDRVFQLESDKNYNFTNLFHLYHYWYPKYKKDIFDISWNVELLKSAEDIYSGIKSPEKETVSIHVRRGDYFNHDHFCKLNTDYYEEALQFFIEEIDRYQFIVFSNDIEWCKENLIEGEFVYFHKSDSDYLDMVLMSLCDHNIVANSSFSWWPAFKNKNPQKTVVCPENYIRSYSPFSFMNKKWYPPDWKAISNDFS